MSDKKINWELVCYMVGACWLVSLALYVTSEALRFPLNPIPKVLAGITGIVVNGYIGAGDRYETAMIFVYATLIGLWLSWLIKKTKLTALVVGITLTIHLILSIVCLPLLMLAAGR